MKRTIVEENELLKVIHTPNAFEKLLGFKEKEKTYKNSKMKFDNELNSEKNLQVAKKLVVMYDFKKDIPRGVQLYMEQRYAPSDISDTYGVQGYIKLTEKNRVIIKESSCFATSVFVNIKLKHLTT